MLLRLGVIASVLVVLASCQLEPGPRQRGGCYAGLLDAGAVEAGARGVELASSFVVLPDTQFYACMYPEIFEAQTEWIVRERAREGIAVVLHTGDLVDQVFALAQWEAASDALHRLDGKVPYVIVAGNHDIDYARKTELREHFQPSDFAGGSARDRVCFRYADDVDHSYALVELRGEPWLFLGLEFAPRDSTVRWANEVLRTHEDVPAVVLTHAYLYSDGTRYDRSLDGGQPFHPDETGLSPRGGVNDGQAIWEKLIELNPNVRLVLSGHAIPIGAARAESRRKDGSIVHEVLANYQTCERCPCEEVKGGNGYLRVLTLSEDRTALRVRTYSPYLDEELTDDANSFTLEL